MHSREDYANFYLLKYLTSILSNSLNATNPSKVVISIIDGNLKTKLQ